MANINELKNRVSGVKSTRQVTHAMYLISASKSKRAKRKSEAVRPFFAEVESIMAEILADRSAIDDSVYTHPDAKADRALFLVMGGDKGMAGGYNYNIIRFLKEKADRSRTTVLMAGFLGRSRAQREGFDVDAGFQFPVMNPSMYRARDMAEIVIEKYLTGRYHEVGLIFTKSETALSQKPVMISLLPLTAEHFMADGRRDADKYRSFNFEPNPVDVLNSLAPHYIKGAIYTALVEACTSELTARMIAMENATKNAEEIIANLSLSYNRARQSKITQEITEIVGGMPDA